MTFAQTAGGTNIENQASATYSDGNGNSYSTVSNTVTVTVANVSGLTITPDAGSRASVVAGQTGVLYSFRVTNTGNFSDQVRFLASGASIQVTGSGTVTRAVIDNGTSAGSIDASDTNVFTNSSDVLSASIARNGYIDVLVEVSVSSSATTGSTVNVQLGDAATGSPSYDNVAIPTGTAASAHEIRTVSSSSVNGLREARGDMSATVENDAQLRLSVTYPAGPVALGSDITYGWQLCNTGSRTAGSITLGSATGVYIVAPIPVGTALASGQTFPSGTLYTTSPLTTAPSAATWTTTAPGTLSTVTRVAFNVGSSLAASACTTAGSFNMVVTITTNDATNDIYEIGDAFAQNTIGSEITDQSGDTASNTGDGNASFNEGAGSADGNGVQVVTLLTRTGSVLIGPSGSPTAVGPSSNNDDYTNRSVNTGIAGVVYGSNTTASGQVVFTNTVRNSGNANDTFVISRQSAPAGFTVEVCLIQILANCTNSDYTPVTTNTLNLAINYNSTANIHVRVTAPSGQLVMSAYPVVIRATSTLTSSAYNETIDRLYTGALRMVKSATVINGTGVGGATDAVPGAVIEYTIAYENLTASGGTGNGGFTISNLVITENGNSLPNNWGTTTTHVAGAASDTSAGSTISGDTAGSSVLSVTVPTLAPGASGTFKFRRTIN